MKKLLEEQIRNINSELELVESVEKKIELRLSFATLLANLENVELPEIPDGKDAIKSDSKKKKKSTSKKKEEKVEAIEEPSVKEEDTQEELTFPEATFNDEEHQNTGIELHEEVSDIPSPAKTEIIIEGVNCAEAYNKLPHDMDEEAHQNIAYYLTVSKEIVPIYDEIIKETNMSHSEHIINLAYLLLNNDLEAVNGALMEFSNGVLKDIYTDLNDNNIEAFMSYLDPEEE